MLYAVLLFQYCLSYLNIDELSPTDFEHSVLSNQDESYFISFLSFLMFFLILYCLVFSTTTCPTCHAVLPQVDKLGSYMKKIGIHVARFLLDNSPEYAQIYDIESVPKFIFFAPGRKPQTFTGNPVIPNMMSFILNNQVGAKQITYMLTHGAVEKVFDSSNTVPLLLLVSEKEKVPPMFKQICFKNRKRLRCAFCSTNSAILEETLTKLQEHGVSDISHIPYPSIFLSTKYSNGTFISYQGEILYSSIHRFVDDSLSKTADSFDPSTTVRPLSEVSEHAGLSALFESNRKQSLQNEL